MTFVKVYKGRLYSGEPNQCPFGVRDLLHDECYSGNGQNKCKYFVRYDHDKHAGCVACTHPPIEQKQPELDFGI